MQIKIDNLNEMDHINNIIDCGEQIIIDGRRKIFIHPIYKNFGVDYNLKVVNIKTKEQLKNFYIDNYKCITIQTDDEIIFRMKSKFILECYLYESFDD